MATKEQALAFWRWVRPRAPWTLTIGAGVAVTIFLAVRSADQTPPSAAENAALVAIAAGLNIVGASGLSRIGRADPRHARSAVRRLISVGSTLATAQERLARARRGEDDLRAAVTTAEAELVSIRPHLMDSVRDWNDVHNEALREVAQGETSEIEGLRQRVAGVHAETEDLVERPN